MSILKATSLLSTVITEKANHPRQKKEKREKVVVEEDEEQEEENRMHTFLKTRKIFLL